jgi:hypothetical protein
MLQRTMPSHQRVLTPIKMARPGIGDDALPGRHAKRVTSDVCFIDVRSWTVTVSLHAPRVDAAHPVNFRRTDLSPQTH